MIEKAVIVNGGVEVPVNTKQKCANLIDTHNANVLVSSTCQIQVTGTASRSITFRG